MLKQYYSILFGLSLRFFYDDDSLDPCFIIFYFKGAKLTGSFSDFLKFSQVIIIVVIIFGLWLIFHSFSEECFDFPQTDKSLRRKTAPELKR